MSSIKLPISMDDDGDLHEQILHIEAHIEELTDIIAVSYTHLTLPTTPYV